MNSKRNRQLSIGDWDRAFAIFTQASKLPEEHRAKFILEATKGDPNLVGEVHSLLALAPGATSFLADPIEPNVVHYLMNDTSRQPLTRERATAAPFVLGKYLLFLRLSEGGMGEVYLGKSIGPGGFQKQLAIKRILSTFSGNSEIRELFEYEARLSSSLVHPNIVQTFDFVKVEDSYLLVMEHVRGVNLAKLKKGLRNKAVRLPIPFGVFIVDQVCLGLDYAQNKKDDVTGQDLNIVHRDISPQNVMISFDGTVKIVDFGIAKAKDSLGKTRTGAIRGKFGYLSPEQALGQPLDGRTDLFSTGILLFEIVTGSRLFAGESDVSSLRQVIDYRVRKPTTIDPTLSGELERVILKAIAREPTDRYQTADAFHRDLQSLLNKEYPSFSLKDFSDFLHVYLEQDIAEQREQLRKLALFSVTEREDQERLNSVRPEVTNTRRTGPESRGTTFRFSWSVVLAALIVLGIYVVHDRTTTVMDCELKIGSAPPGAEAVVDGRPRGKTPLALPFGCGKAARVSLDLQGYEPVSEEVALGDSGAEVFKSLTKLRMATLEFVLDNKADIYLDGDFIAAVRANQKFQLSLVPQRQHKLRFIDASTHKSAEEDVLLKSGEIRTSHIHLK